MFTKEFIIYTGTPSNTTISQFTCMKEEHSRAGKKRRREEVNEKEYSQMEILDQPNSQVIVPHTTSLSEEQQSNPYSSNNSCTGSYITRLKKRRKC